MCDVCDGFHRTSPHSFLLNFAEIRRDVFRRNSRFPKQCPTHLHHPPSSPTYPRAKMRRHTNPSRTSPLSRRLFTSNHRTQQNAEAFRFRRSILVIISLVPSQPTLQCSHPHLAKFFFRGFRGGVLCRISRSKLSRPYCFN